jgi:hypothetical protein
MCIATFVVMVMSFQRVYSQNQNFSFKFHLGSNTLANNLVETSTGFLITGAGFDTVGTIHSDMFIFSVDYIGASVQLFHSGNPGSTYYPRSKTIGTFGDSTHIVAFLQYIENVEHCALFWFDQSGDTIKTMLFPSPVFDQHEFLDVHGLVVDSTNDCFYLSLGTATPETNNDYVIQKRNKEGVLIWEYFSNGPSMENTQCMTITPSGLIVAEAGALNDEYYSGIRKISNYGQSMWFFETPYIQGAPIARDIFFVNDTIYASGSGTNEGEIFNVPLFYTTDTLGNLGWVTLIQDSAFSGQILKNFTTTCDGGFVGAATYRDLPNLNDTLNSEDNYSAWIIRYDHNGNILWDRKYSVVNSGIYHHEIYDLISTSDGGILFCGEARDNWLENPNLDWPPQQAWVVKLDACGCLVPGCDEFCSPPNCDLEIPIDLHAPDHFIFGPNPITQSLNIYFDGSDLILENLSFELYDITGRLVDRFKPNTSDTTYMWDLEHLSAGEYILTLLDRDQIIQSEKIIVR